MRILTRKKQRELSSFIVALTMRIYKTLIKEEENEENLQILCEVLDTSYRLLGGVWAEQHRDGMYRYMLDNMKTELQKQRERQKMNDTSDGIDHI